MAGILNNKERVMDFILTENGRKQLLSGEMQIKFASYSDIHAFYEGTGGVADDASNRIYLEAYSRKQDNITPDTNFNGDIINFQSGDVRLAGATVFSNNVGASSAADASTFFSSFLSGSIENFAQNYILGELDEFSSTDPFSISNKNLDFSVKDFEFKSAVSVLALPIFFEDQRFRTISNFAYLPPTDFLSTRENTEQVFRDVRKQNQTKGGIFESQKKKIVFESASRTYNLMIQFFQQDEFGRLKKLHVLDMGESINMETTEVNNSYQIGKIFTNTDGTDCFVDIFSLVLKK